MDKEEREKRRARLDALVAEVKELYNNKRGELKSLPPTLPLEVRQPDPEVDHYQMLSGGLVEFSPNDEGNYDHMCSLLKKGISFFKSVDLRDDASVIKWLANDFEEWQRKSGNLS